MLKQSVSTSAARVRAAIQTSPGPAQPMDYAESSGHSPKAARIATERQHKPASAPDSDQRHAPEEQLCSLCILCSEKLKTPLHHVFSSQASLLKAAKLITAAKPK